MITGSGQEIKMWKLEFCEVSNKSSIIYL